MYTVRSWRTQYETRRLIMRYYDSRRNNNFSYEKHRSTTRAQSVPRRCFTSRVLHILRESKTKRKNLNRLRV